MSCLNRHPCHESSISDSALQASLQAEADDFRRARTTATLGLDRLRDQLQHAEQQRVRGITGARIEGQFKSHTVAVVSILKHNAMSAERCRCQNSRLRGQCDTPRRDKDAAAASASKERLYNLVWLVCKLSLTLCLCAQL